MLNACSKQTVTSYVREKQCPWMLVRNSPFYLSAKHSAKNSAIFYTWLYNSFVCTIVLNTWLIWYFMLSFTNFLKMLIFSWCPLLNLYNACSPSRHTTQMNKHYQTWSVCQNLSPSNYTSVNAQVGLSPWLCMTQSPIEFGRVLTTQVNWSPTHSKVECLPKNRTYTQYNNLNRLLQT